MSSFKKRLIQVTGTVLFMIYLILLVYLLFFAEEYGRTQVAEGLRYNIVPFREIHRYLHNRDVLGDWNVLLNLGGNVIGFMPFGMCMPVMHPRLRKCWKVVLITMLFSISVELIQLFTHVGSCDVDDVILNTLGGWIGYIVFAAANRWRRRIYG